VVCSAKTLLLLALLRVHRRLKGGAMHARSIAVVDCSSGERSIRASDTQTLDLPADFDREKGVASVDLRERATYLAMNGATLVSSSRPRPLSWRVRGEECLVADSSASESGRAYRRCLVDPARR
jgi:hypothetical protein